MSSSTAGDTIPVRVKPGASRTAVGSGYDGPYGRALVVAVTAPAVDGRANDAVVRAVAAALGLRPARITIRTGTTGRNKLLAVTDPPPDLRDRIAELISGPTG